jgi:hypothetical protein
MYFTAVNSNGEYLKDKSGDSTESMNCAIDASKYDNESLGWLISNKICFQTYVLPTVLPLADIKFYKNMESMGQAEGLLSLEDKIQGLGSTRGDAIVMVLPGEECNCE